MPKQLWVVRAGRDAVYCEDFLRLKVVAIGWWEAGDLTRLTSREQIAKAIAKSYPDASKGTLSSYAGQVQRFRFDLKKDESVVTYDAAKRLYHIGTVVGDYEYHPECELELRNSRAVTWLGTVPRDKLSAATKNSLGSISTIFRASETASEEILSILKAPAPVAEDSTASTTTADLIPDDEVQVRENIEQSAMDFLQDRIIKLTWSQMQELVAG